jgi:hypothetical protein
VRARVHPHAALEPSPGLTFERAYSPDSLPRARAAAPCRSARRRWPRGGRQRRRRRARPGTISTSYNPSLYRAARGQSCRVADCGRHLGLSRATILRETFGSSRATRSMCFARSSRTASMRASRIRHTASGLGAGTCSRQSNCGVDSFRYSDLVRPPSDGRLHRGRWVRRSRHGDMGIRDRPAAQH